MKLSLIVAIGENNVIGINGKMPWNLKSDLDNFKKITAGGILIMGRKTFESIGKPLPNRVNIVISRSHNNVYGDSSVIWVSSIEEALNRAREYENKETFIIGGAQVYTSTINLCSTIYLTRVHGQFAGDTYFPTIPMEEFVIEDNYEVDNEGEIPYSFMKLTRK